MTKQQLDQIKKRADAAPTKLREINESASECIKKLKDKVKRLKAEVERLKEFSDAQAKEITRLVKIINRDLNENDELGAEYTYVNTLRDENKRLRERLRGALWFEATMCSIPQTGAYIAQELEKLDSGGENIEDLLLNDLADKVKLKADPGGMAVIVVDEVIEPPASDYYDHGLEKRLEEACQKYKSDRLKKTK